MAEMTWGQMKEEAKKQGFEPLPIGTYDMRVEQTKIVPGKVAQQIQIRMVVTSGPIAGRSTINRLVPIKNDGEINGMFFQQCAALGLPDTDPLWAQLDQQGLSLEQGLGIIAGRIDGAMCVADIDHQNWNGEIRDNVKKMRPYQGGFAPGGTIPGAVPQVPGAFPPQAPAMAPGQAPMQPPDAPMPQGYPQAPEMPQAAPAAAPAPTQPAPAPVAPQQPMAPQAPPVDQPLAPQAPPQMPVPPAPQPGPSPQVPAPGQEPTPTAPAPPTPVAPAPPAPPPYVEQAQPQGGVQPTAPVENPSI